MNRVFVCVCVCVSSPGPTFIPNPPFFLNVCPSIRSHCSKPWKLFVPPLSLPRGQVHVHRRLLLLRIFFCSHVPENSRRTFTAFTNVRGSRVRGLRMWAEPSHRCPESLLTHPALFEYCGAIQRITIMYL